MEEVVRGGSRLVGEGKLIREGRASASRRQAGAIKEGSRLLPSRRVLRRAITACAIKAGIVAVILGRIVKGGVRVFQRRIHLALGLDSIRGRYRRQSCLGSSWIRSVPAKVRFGFAPCPAGKPGPSSLYTLQADRVWVRSVT